jgi:hypothetical protein
MSTTVGANGRATDDVCRPQKNLRRSESPAYQRRGCFRGPFRGQLRGPFRGHRFPILKGMSMCDNLDREQRCARLSRRTEAHADQLRGGSARTPRGGTRAPADVSDQKKNQSAEVRAEGFAEVRAEDEGAHSPAWQRVRASVESATSR